MKIKWLLLLIFFVTISAFNLKSSLDFNSLSINIENNNKIYKPNDVVFYTINICSNENIENFEVVPEIIGKNQDSKVDYNFNFKTKTVTINYFYVIPDDLKNVTSIKIFFSVKNKSKEKIIEKIIKLQ